ncbi:disulfide formation protein [Caldalkalibacillus thermarum TA2.A1]|uniref:Probable disulfide formation protein n=1 Tax=Caldalkalibacillus thermarum (strain TA2.A1) TaxID=986075 RepID=F5L5C9_CALTT|nr:disulfide oxidoreductase [Caldalkalibacillus thermarum]EGL83464.1 disulfide formation protein [Caldalkalibacillus thermarum TA2.A1]QZT34929.1 disulfide bond formation protein B [Caldalkalibacillus thermarum TA2.A1]GGK11336.1 disulfide bond formation protein C [Caldalkalibacillus thermarum]
MSKDSLSHSTWPAYTLYLAWLVAVVATLGSLYFSEVRGFVPCELCWYQRIFMYPLAVMLGIAAYRGDAGIKVYVLPLAMAGGLISLVHYLQQKVPALGAIALCTQGVPCTAVYINWLGFITIPFLALMAFGAITILMLVTPGSKTACSRPEMLRH